MKHTLEVFLEKNNELKFFSDEDAKLYYGLLSIDKIDSAMLILIDRFRKLGWKNINDRCNINYNESSFNLNSEVINSYLDFTLDDLIVGVSGIPGAATDYGNYLLTNLLNVNDSTIYFAKEDILLTKMTLCALGNKKGFIKEINSIKNRSTPSLESMVECLAVYKLLTASEDPTIGKLLMSFTHISRKYAGHLLFILRIYEPLLVPRGNTKVLCRLKLMKIRNKPAYIKFIAELSNYRRISRLVDLLDIYE